jgi:hypothetical protein
MSSAEQNLQYQTHLMRTIVIKPSHYQAELIRKASLEISKSELRLSSGNPPDRVQPQCEQVFLKDSQKFSLAVP